jgi:hypothetical protein
VLLDFAVTPPLSPSLRTTGKAAHGWESSCSPVLQAAHPDQWNPYVVVQAGVISVAPYLVLFVKKISLRQTIVDLWILGSSIYSILLDRKSHSVETLLSTKPSQSANCAEQSTTTHIAKLNQP